MKKSELCLKVCVLSASFDVTFLLVLKKEQLQGSLVTVSNQFLFINMCPGFSSSATVTLAYERGGDAHRLT